MSSAEHLIENCIFADYQGKDLDKILDDPYNKIMLEETGIRKDDLIRMTYHVIYTLYDGINPFSQEWETRRQLTIQSIWNKPSSSTTDDFDDKSLGAMMLFGHDD